eukprot:jgi/Chlat1/7334/Chrsp59S06970
MQSEQQQQLAGGWRSDDATDGGSPVRGRGRGRYNYPTGDGRSRGRGYSRYTGDEPSGSGPQQQQQQQYSQYNNSSNSMDDGQWGRGGRGRGSGRYVTREKGGYDRPQPLTAEELESIPSEHGVVVTVRDSYGFIRGVSRNEELFFHVSEVLDMPEAEHGARRADLSEVIQAGDEVEFKVTEPLNKNGRPNAKHIKVLPKGTIEVEEPKGEHLHGFIERELRGGQRSRRDAYGGRIAYHTLAPPGLANDDFNASADSATASVTFDGGDVRDQNVRLGVGDEVEFMLVADRRTGDSYATDVALIARAAPAQADTQVQEGGGASTQEPLAEKGFVTSLKETYGFIQSADRQARVFFHFSALEGVRGDELQLGDEVEFSVRPDARSGKTLAVPVRRLPKGTIMVPAKEVEDSEATIETGSITSLKASFGFVRSALRGTDVFFHFSEVEDGASAELEVGDRLDFTVVKDTQTGNLKAIRVSKAAGPPDYVSVSEERYQGVCMDRLSSTQGTAGRLQCTLDGQEETLMYGNADLEDGWLNPRVGEQVEFNLAVDGNQQRMATNVNLLRYTGAVVGVKASTSTIAYELEDGTKAQVLCRFSDVTDGVHLREGDEVEFIPVQTNKSTDKLARKVRRTKEAPPSPEPPPREKMKFEGSSTRITKGPDGTKGFGAGRGKLMPPPPTAPEETPTPAPDEEGDESPLAAEGTGVYSDA